MHCTKCHGTHGGWWCPPKSTIIGGVDLLLRRGGHRGTEPTPTAERRLRGELMGADGTKAHVTVSTGQSPGGMPQINTTVGIEHPLCAPDPAGVETRHAYELERARAAAGRDTMGYYVGKELAEAAGDIMSYVGWEGSDVSPFMRMTQVMLLTGMIPGADAECTCTGDEECFAPALPPRVNIVDV
jgi:hypothetical protein